ncbi:MAG: flagellar basal-body rod protein FlgF [Chitinivibrionales bacterium]|nr:flagellar basal-body rod protein FlgF [Chitinivibrionales bacterium]
MVSGIYLSAHGMDFLMNRQEQIANNLANINTTGYKASDLFSRAYQRYLTDDVQRPGVNREIKADQVFVDYSEGPMHQTDQPLDCCIRGTGFFTVMGAGGVSYTRNGNFSMDADGYLVTAEGAKVLGEQGYIRCNRKQQIDISENGNVMQDNQLRGQLKIADFKKPYKMLRTGNSCFVPQQPDNPEIKSTGFAVKAGYLEGSNANPIRTMTDMIDAERGYEANAKVLLAQDDTLDKAVNQIGRVGG